MSLRILATLALACASMVLGIATMLTNEVELVAQNRTLYWAKSSTVHTKLARFLGVSEMPRHLEDDPTGPPEVARQRRLKSYSRLAGAPIDIVLSGAGDTNAFHVCRIQIGPSEVQRPVSPDFMFDLVDNRELAARLRAAVGVVPIDKFYMIDVEVDGVRVRLEQFDYGSNYPEVRFVLDGCLRSELVPYDYLATGDAERRVDRWSVPIFQSTVRN